MEQPTSDPSGTTKVVRVERSVRYNRLLVVGAIIGAALGAGYALLFPVVEGAHYTLAQAMGFAAVIGSAIGLALGGVLGLILGLSAKRKKGTAVATQSDVR